jgi:hypothetical protein
MISRQRRVLIVECLFLFILACICWATGIESRIYLTNLDQEDFIDFCMVNSLVFSGFWLYRLYFLCNSKRKRNINKVLLTGCFFFILWEFLLFYLYSTFYYKVSLSETDFYEIVVPLAIFVSIGFAIYFKQNYVLEKVFEVREDVTSQHLEEQTNEFFSQNPAASNHTSKITVSKGNNTILLSEDNILMIYTRDKVAWLFTDSNEKYISSYALKELEEKLSSTSFFRINRQVILSKKVVKGYLPLENQKLMVQLTIDTLEEDERVVSKYTAPEFKKWLLN